MNDDDAQVNSGVDIVAATQKLNLNRSEETNPEELAAKTERRDGNDYDSEKLGDMSEVAISGNEAEDMQSGNENEESDEISLIARLPFEILASILAQIAIDSPKAFLRTQLISRSFRIPYDSALLWEPICRSTYPDIDSDLHVDHYGSYYNMFRQCPAVRYNGVYVCTSKYYREGESEGISWTKPRHEVRYYRYFWLEKNGICRSLLANHSPQHMLGIDTPMSPIAGKAYRQDVMVGRWTLDRNTKSVHISVDGGRRRCQFHFEMMIASSGGKVHNKLKWKKYWCEEHGSGNEATFNTENEGSYYFLKYQLH